MVPTTPAELEAWRHEWGLVDGLLRRIEEAEHAILRSIGWPIDVIAIDDRLKQERGRTGRAAKNRERAIHAMHVLVLVSQTCSNLTLGKEHPLRAVYQALLAGIYAGDAALNALVAERRRVGGRTRGDAISCEARARDAEIGRYIKQFRVSEKLQDEHGTATSYAQKRSGLSKRSIQRRKAKTRQ